MDSERLVLFDGSALVHRAYHAMPPLTLVRTGEMVGAVYGFAMILIRAINDLKPTHYAIAFDKRAPTFRHLLFEDYKANRPATPSELVMQFNRVRELVKAFRIPIYELEGYEADDILGTLSEQAVGNGIDTVVVTGDADMMQLVSGKVKVFYPRTGGGFSDAILYNEEEVVRKYGVKPLQIPDLKALKGDPSDNIPGVPGVGDKTASKLIQQFGSIDQILAHLEEITPPRLREKLKENEALVLRSHELATIKRDVPVSLDLDICCQITQYDRGQVVELFRELNFTSLLDKLPDPGKTEVGAPPQTRVSQIQANYKTINTAPELEEVLQQVKSADSLAILIGASTQNAITAEITGLAISPNPGEAYYIPAGPAATPQMELIPSDNSAWLSRDQVMGYIKPLLEDPRWAKLTHNGKTDMEVLAEHGITLNNMSFDTMIAAHLLGEKSVSLKEIAFGRLGVEIKTLADLIGTGSKQILLSQVDVEQVSAYACANADFTGRLSHLLQAELQQQGIWKLFSEVEIALVPVLAGMERSGVALDTGLLQQMSVRLGEKIAELEAKIYGNAGHEFNINSPAQLGNVLFQELGLPGRKVRGKFTTEVSVLYELRGYPIIQDIMEYRQLIKLKSTYIDTLPLLVNPRTGRVHTSFNQTRTATGRLSSSDPNLQNIPVRGELGREIRRAFIAPPGSYLLAGDYSQIDLRALAHLSQDEGLLEAFRQDKDIHSATASQLFGVQIPDITPDMRRLAKTVNFGVIYGMSEYGLEQATELSRKEASKFITAYFEKYPGVRKYLDSTKEQARQTGFVQTEMGRRRYVPEINSPNRLVSEAAERMAINMPVQGTSADIIKVAMVDLAREMDCRQLKSKMILQVHDELIFEVPEPELEEMRNLVREKMSTAVKISVPLKVDIKTGHNWGEME